MFALEGLTKRYGARHALQPTTHSFDPARTSVLIGPSGCGKSTLIRLMLGLLAPDGGEVRFDGALVSDASVQEVRRRVGYVIQDGGLFPHLTAEGNVTLMARYLGWEGARIDSRVEELCALTRFPNDGLSRFPAQLSGGQRQRVGLMRALMLDPDALLLDEPLGALDPLIRSELQTDLAEIFSRLHKTVVLVTHDLGEAAFFADTILLMRDGAIVQIGTLADLWEHPNDPFVTRFVNAQRSPLQSLEAQG